MHQSDTWKHTVTPRNDHRIWTKVNYTYNPLKERSMSMWSLPHSLQRNINNAAENLTIEVQGERQNAYPAFTG